MGKNAGEECIEVPPRGVLKQAFCKCTTMRVARLLLAAQAARALVDVEWYGYSS